MRFSVETISPNMAQDLLQQNFNNRKLNQARVAAMARDIAAGKWRLTPQGIAISKAGRLLDGQHRLTAVVQANCAVRMTVVRDCDELAQRFIDLGDQRSLQNELQMEGVKNSRTVSACARHIAAIENGLDKSDLTKYRTREELRNVISRYSTGFSWLLTKQKPQISRGGYISPLVFVYNTLPSEVDSFYNQVDTGVGLDSGSPALLLRNWLLTLRSSTGSSIDRTIVLKTFAALDAYVDGKSMIRLHSNESSIAKLRARVVHGFSKKEALIHTLISEHSKF